MSSSASHFHRFLLLLCFFCLPATAMGRRRSKSFCSAIGSVLLFLLHSGSNFLPRATLPSRRRQRKKKVSPLATAPRSPPRHVVEQAEASSTSSLRSLIRQILCCFILHDTFTSLPGKIADDPRARAPSRIVGELPRTVSLKSSSMGSRDADVFTVLADGDSGLNIVRIIFLSAWKGKEEGRTCLSGSDSAVPVVLRVLKIQSSARMLACFEECRDSIRSRAADSGDERCMADGNERLRFCCATFLCGLAEDDSPGVCSSPYCCACTVARRGFGDKDADGVVTHATGWGAHSALPYELEREFAAMHVRRAMLLCRVVAGRVAGGDVDAAERPKAKYDSAEVDDLLMVFDPRAVLPCFLIIYSV